jgi:uncharacterized protein YcbK (DUF882 family)
MDGRLTMWAGGLPLAILLSLLAPRDAPAHGMSLAPMAIDTPLAVAARQARRVAWASALAPLSVTDGSSRARDELRLYTPEGEVDVGEKARFEGLVGRDGQAHELSERVIKLLFKAAYHFARVEGAAAIPPAVTVVSAWREHAGRHTSGDAIDFKLAKVPAAQLAAYLRGLPRVGVGIYTHPRTQYVHLDVRDTSYHWLDASPPGVRWRERQLRDPGQAKRDAAWSTSSDLPLEG